MEEYKQNWEKAVVMLSNLVQRAAFESFILCLVPVKYDGNVFTLTTNSTIGKEFQAPRYLNRIEMTLSEVYNKQIKVNILLEEEYENMSSRTDLAVQDSQKTESNFYDKYVFDTFVYGANSQLAYVSAKKVAEEPGQDYNPLFMWGGVGLGKTHLMYAIYNYIKKHHPEKKILYCTSEEFLNEFIASIGKGAGYNNNSKEVTSNSKFRSKYRDVDVLLIDDVQFFSGKESTQTELFHTFNTLTGIGKQVVISSDQPPQKLEFIEKRLSSRFSQGLIVDISLPDFETRSAILNKKAELLGLDVPDEVITFIAENISTNIRELEGALTRVAAFSKLKAEPISLSLSEQALKDIINKPIKQEITTPFIQEIVANHFNITVEDIRGKKRPANIAYARQVAMYLSCKHTDDTLVRVGKEYFGGRDHSTVHYATKVISKDIAEKEGTREMILELESKIKG